LREPVIIMAKTLYETLHVLPNADPSVVTAAGRALLKRYHPDGGGDADRFAQITEAKTVLDDPDRRAAYDTKLQEASEKVVGDYRIVRKMTEGGFGRLFEGEHVVTGIKACIKQNLNVSPEDTDLFIQEARAIADLRHHALPAFRDFYKLPDGSCALVMSYIEGPTLEQLVEKTKTRKLEPEQAAWITERVLDALRYTHYHGVVHGDVKPQNIIIQPDEHTAALVDYGLASIRPSSGSRAVGYTPQFTAPEVLAGKPPLPESDLYSVGMTMIYALGGDIGSKRIPVSVPDALGEFIGKLVVHDVRKRPHWDREDVVQTLRNARLAAFGRTRTSDNTAAKK
jgi:serine/threonine protein kinase